MALKRVLIKTDANDEIKADSTGPIFFNPSEYTVQKKVNWTETKGRGLDLPQLQFDSGGFRSVSMSLVFDTYESGVDVRQKTKQVAQLAEVKEGKDRPPLCTVFWGGDGVPFTGLPFQGVVESLTQKYTLFSPDGTPVRATVEIQFKAVESPEKQLQRTKRKTGSPLQAKSRVIRQGDSLWGIAAEEYGSAAKWRSIAQANGIVNPRRLEPGQTILVPSIE